jgi:hypothetical protein
MLKTSCITKSRSLITNIYSKFRFYTVVVVKRGGRLGGMGGWPVDTFYASLLHQLFALGVGQTQGEKTPCASLLRAYNPRISPPKLPGKQALRLSGVHILFDNFLLPVVGRSRQSYFSSKSPIYERWKGK